MRVSQEFKFGLRRSVVAGLFTTAGLVAISTYALQAQDNGGLRGGVEPDVSATLAQTPTTAPTPPTYIPVSPGAVPDDTSDDLDAVDGESLFGDIAAPPADDVDVPLPVANPARARTSAQGEDDAAATETQDATTGQAEPLDAEATGVTRAESVGAAERIDLGDEAGRIEAIEGRDRVPDDDPFAPLGIRVGTFILRPSIEQGLTSTSNANFSTEGESALLSETTLRLNAVSDWSRHSASLDAFGNFRETLDGYEISETRAGIDAALNLDLADELRARTTLNYERTPETASSPVEIEGTLSEPIRQTFGVTQSLEKDIGKARFAITGLLEHDDYGDADLIDGSVLSQEDRNTTLATLTLRGGYEISPAITPFIEAEIGKRFYDEEVDSAGFDRESDRLGLRGGVEVDLNEKIIGEVSAGWIQEDFADERLNPIEGPSLNAALTWSPERETTVRLDASTRVEGATDPGESGSILHSGLLTVERTIRANLTANAALSVGYRDYSGSEENDLLLSAEVGSTWWLNRYAGITGRLRHERQQSDPDTRDYDANSVFLGLRVQR